MQIRTFRGTAAAIALLLASAAHAQYRCADAQNWIDRRGCAAAQKGPDELRRFVWQMSRIRIDVAFDDYVDEKTLLAWEAQASGRRAAQAPGPAASAAAVVPQPAARP
jgi:hypothetical protein